MDNRCQPRKRPWTGVFGLAFAVGLCVGVGAAEANCRDRLLFDTEYECEFVSDLSPTIFDGTLLFEEFDGNAFTATLDTLGEVTVSYCTCKTRGPIRNPRFDRGRAFECVVGLDVDVAETMEGVPTGNGEKIKRGRIWFADPFAPPPDPEPFVRLVFECETT